MMKQWIFAALSLPLFATPTFAVDWPSGAFSPNAFFNRINGTQQDVCLLYGNKSSTWTELGDQVKAGAFDRSKCKSFVFSMRIFPTDQENPHAKGCSAWKSVAEGKYNSYYKNVGKKIAALGIPLSQITMRVGWEINADYPERPWFIGACNSATPGSANSAEHVRQGYRNIILSLRSQTPNIKTSWNWLKNASRAGLPISHFYPGSDVISIISVDYYDIGLADYKNIAAFNKITYEKGTIASPLGLKSWMDYAISLGKKVAVEEWGIFAGGSGGSGDNPAYIQGMFEFFRMAHGKNALAHEIYFNNSDYSVLGTSSHPQATKEYDLRY